MPKITFKDKQGSIIETVDVPADTSVMEAARFRSSKQYIPGIEAVCGGSAICGTCHVYVDDAWINKIEPVDEDGPERTVLEYVEKYNETKSRCGCQVILHDEHDGIEVQIP